MLSECIHSRNLFPFFNSGENGEKYSFIASHIESCTECQNRYSQIKIDKERIESLVPRKEITLDLQATFDLEIKSVVDKSLYKINDVKNVSFIPVPVKNHVRDIYLAFTSRTLLRAYFFCGVYIFIVKSFNT